MKVYYFGCWTTIGHFLWTPNADSVPLSAVPWGNAVDTGLCPGKRDRRGEVACDDQWEGHAALHHLDGWTALAFWDRSVDTRHGSNSVFIAEGTLSLADMIVVARDAFPALMARFTFVVRVDP